MRGTCQNRPPGSNVGLLLSFSANIPPSLPISAVSSMQLAVNAQIPAALGGLGAMAICIGM